MASCVQRMGQKMDGIIEYVNIPWNMDLFRTTFNNTLNNWQGRNYIECGAKSHVLSENIKFETAWKDILTEHKRVHNIICPLATGFNFNATEKHTVPPHIDIDKPLYFNLLIPVFGTAKLNIFETNEDHLEFRHGMTHWKMVKDDKPKNKIGEFLVDKPVILNTNFLHDVEPIVVPRCVWCTRWIDIDMSFSFNSFKSHVESVLNET